MKIEETPAVFSGRTACAATILAGLTLLLYLYTSAQYPFYFMWDMDQWAVVESLAINSDQVPLVVIHPGFGTLFLNHFTHEIASRMGIVTLDNLHSLEQSLNPMLALAELTAFFRFHPPVLAAGVVSCLWATLLILFRPGAAWSALLWLTLATQSSLFYNASMIRSELYAVFYWSIALLLMACAVTSKRKHAPTILFIFAGIFLGLSWLAKMQATFYLVALPIIVATATNLSTAARANAPTLMKNISAPTLRILALGAVAAIIGLIVTAYGFNEPEGTFGLHYSKMELQSSGLGLLVSALCLAIYFSIPTSRRPLNQPLLLFTFMGATLLSGFLASFLLHFLLYGDPSVGRDYLLQDAKAVFWLLSWDKFDGFDAYFTLFAQHLCYHPVLFTTFALAVALTLVQLRLESGRANAIAAGYILAVTAIIVLNMTVAVRFILRDLIWVEIITVFFSLLLLTWTSCSNETSKPLRKAVATLLVVMLLGANAFHASRMKDRVDALYNVFGWQSEKWAGAWFNPPEFERIMTAKLGAHLPNAFRQATRHSEVKKLVRYVFKNQNIDLRHVGILADGMPVLVSDQEWRISSAPEELKNAVIVDSFSVPVRNGAFFQKSDRHEEYLDQLSTHPSDKQYGAKIDSTSSESRWLSVLGRPDLKVYLFVAAPDISNVRTTGLALEDTGLEINLVRRDETISFIGLLVERYNVIDVGALDAPYFFAIEKLPMGFTPPRLMMSGWQ